MSSWCAGASGDARRSCSSTPASHIAEPAAVPKHVEILAELPKTAVGKVFKPDLRRRAITRVFDAALADGGVGGAGRGGGRGPAARAGRGAGAGPEGRDDAGSRGARRLHGALALAGRVTPAWRMTGRLGPGVSAEGPRGDRGLRDRGRPAAAGRGAARGARPGGLARPAQPDRGARRRAIEAALGIEVPTRDEMAGDRGIRAGSTPRTARST